ncbi:hypothetical protein B0J12DRAFT_71196 [Macrophomina phaseolina]|uniref:Protein kinase domain-containing protein n=1 Tax=Macrophomina phaseolina TaxID=35725 RepID=A0ABQ8GDD3_9PEZI|nr:hypothetical protein B0J12DRAFT_71196 [Macrophomina phaseolina]
MEIRGFGRSGLGSISGVAFSFFPLRDGVGSFVRDGGGNGDFVAVKMMVASRPSLLRYSKEPMADFPESLFLVGSVCVLRVSRVNFLPAAWFLILWRGRTTEMRYSASVFGSFIGRAPCNFVSDAVPFSVSLSLPFRCYRREKIGGNLAALFLFTSSLSLFGDPSGKKITKRAMCTPTFFSWLRLLACGPAGRPRKDIPLNER